MAEKKPISKNATVGIYWWKKGSDYVKYAEQMIKKDIRTNNEFYVCPVFNEAIQDGKKVTFGNLKEGKMDGEWTFYHDNGQPASEMIFKNGELIEKIGTWDENGSAV